MCFVNNALSSIAILIRKALVFIRIEKSWQRG